MRKSALCVALLFSMAANLFSKGSDWGFDFETSSRLLWGSTGEYVYERTGGSHRKLSYLEWETKPIFVQDLKGSVQYKKLRFGTLFAFGIPAKCGYIYDSDWQDYAVKNLYSKSTNDLDFYFKTEGTVSYAFDFSRLHLLPFVSVGYRNVRFEGHDGYALYAKKGEPYKDGAPYSFSGKVLAYETFGMQTWLGAAAQYTVGRLRLGISGALMPFQLVYCADTHYLTKTDYLDIVSGFFCGAKGECSVAYRVTDFLSVSVGASAEKAFKIKGDSYAKKSGENDYSKMSNARGAYEYAEYGFFAGLKVHF